MFGNRIIEIDQKSIRWQGDIGNKETHRGFSGEEGAKSRGLRAVG